MLELVQATPNRRVVGAASESSERIEASHDCPPGTSSTSSSLLEGSCFVRILPTVGFRSPTFSASILLLFCIIVYETIKPGPRERAWFAPHTDFDKNIVRVAAGRDELSTGPRTVHRPGEPARDAEEPPPK